MDTDTVCVSGPLTILGENLEELGEEWELLVPTLLKIVMCPLIKVSCNVLIFVGSTRGIPFVRTSFSEKIRMHSSRMPTDRCSGRTGRGMGSSV